MLLVGFLRPLDGWEWFALAACLAFVLAGGFALLRYEALAARRGSPSAVAWPLGATAVPDADDLAGADSPTADVVDLREPTQEERDLLRTAIDAFEEAGALVPGEVDIETLWRAAQHIDPGPVVDVYMALTTFSVLEDLGRPKLRRLTYVPVGTEYDAALIAALTAGVLTSLGHAMSEADVTVELPIDGSEGAAAVEFAIDGRRQRVPFHYQWKLHPPELFEALARFTRQHDPRDLVCADSDYQQLLYAAIRPGALDRLNRRFPIADLFGPA